VEADPRDQETSLPEPDLAVVAELNPEHDSRHPRGDETILVVEVSDTTLRHDLTTKRDLYARAKVPEYWVVDLKGRRLVVHCNPQEGVYQEVQVLKESDEVTLAAPPHPRFHVSFMLP